MMLCAPGDLGGADNPSGLSLTKLTLQIVSAVSNYWEGTPLQAPTKRLNPRTYVAIKPRVGAHWGLYPAWGKNKVGRKSNPAKSPIPSEFSCVLCCSKLCAFCLWAVEVAVTSVGWDCCPTQNFPWAEPLHCSAPGVMRYQGAALTLEKPQGLSWLGVKLFEYFKMKIRYGDFKKALLETRHLLKCILGNGYVCSGWS